MKYLLRIYYHLLTHTLLFCCVRWHMEDPGKCSARCGPGYKSRPVRCMRVSNGRWSIVQDKHCPGAKPAVVVPCEGTCEGTRWVYTKWTQVFFSHVPVMYLFYQLVGEDHQLTYNHRNACLLYYLQCSKSCDKGEQTRQATCVDTFGEILIDRDCRPKDKQALRQQCNNFKCPWWTEGVWSSVSRTFLKFQFFSV